MTTIAVIGTGAMGRGIIQWAAESGATVLAYDQADGAADKAISFVVGLLDRAVAKNRISQDVRDDRVSRIKPVSDLSDLASADVVIEAILEDLDIKRALFKELEAVVGRDTLLCTNTSSLSVTSIAFGCEYPDRVAGLHFFNPVPLMRVVEVISGERTDPKVVQILLDIVKRTQHHPVICSDNPGFVVNHAGRGLYTEGLRIVQETVAEPVDVDRIIRGSLGLPMGPFELFDLTGLDVSGRVLHEIYDAFYQEPRYRPTPLVRRRIAAGLLGRKTGAGFYTYVDNKRVEPTEPHASNANAGSYFIDASGPEAETLATLLIAGGGTLAPVKTAATIIVAPVGQDATTACIDAGHDPTRTLAIDLLFPMALKQGGRQTVMTTPATDSARVDALIACLSRAGQSITVIQDSPGFVAQRVASNIVNTSCEIAQMGIATPLDINAGVTGGLGYPLGPLALGDQIGPLRVLEILENLQSATGDPRYRPSMWLIRRAKLGLSLMHTNEKNE